MTDFAGRLTRSEFAAIVERARADHPVWFDLEGDRPPTAGEVTEIEQQLGASLPADFVWFLTEYGGGDFALCAIYSGDKRSDLYLLANQGESCSGAFVAFGDNGGGDLFGFTVSDGKCGDAVMFLDHESRSVVCLEAGGFLDFVNGIAFHPA